MQNQFCKNCGQANLPNSSTCTKCGNPLNKGTNNPFGANNVASSTPPPKKKSNMIFWVAGIVVVLLVLFVGLVGIAGIGGYFYFTSQEKVEREYPGRDPKQDDDKPTKDDDEPKKDDTKDDDSKGNDDDSPLSDIKFPSTEGSDDDLGETTKTGGGKVTDAQLVAFFLTQKPKVGRYTVKNATTLGGGGNSPNRMAGAKAEYRSGSKKVFHEIALYDSKPSLADDFAAYKRKARSGGGRVQTTKATSIIYIKGRLVYLAFYNPQGGFHIMSSRNGKDILAYHNAYFGINE